MGAAGGRLTRRAECEEGRRVATEEARQGGGVGWVECVGRMGEAWSVRRCGCQAVTVARWGGQGSGEEGWREGGRTAVRRAEGKRGRRGGRGRGGRGEGQ